MTTTIAPGPSPNLLDYLVGQCTAGVAAIASWVGKDWGDASQWAQNAQAQGLTVNKTDTLGSIADWAGSASGPGWHVDPAGHVAEVVGYSSTNLPIVEEQNWLGTGIFDIRELSPSEAAAASYIQPPGQVAMTPLGDAALSGHGPDQAIRVAAPASTAQAQLESAGQTINPAPDPAGILTGPAQFVGSVLGTAAGTAAGATASGILTGLTAGLETFFSSTVTPWFVREAIPLTTGVIIAYIVLGPEAAKGAAGQGQAVIQNILQGAKGARQGFGDASAAGAGAEAADILPLAAV